MDGPDFEALYKRIRKPTTSQNAQDKIHFATPVSHGKMAEICKGYVPLTTVRSTTWAVHGLDQWQEEHNKHCSEQCPLV